MEHALALTPVRRRSVLKWTVRTVCIVASIGFFGFLAPLPVGLLTPGPAENVASEFLITGIEVTPINGTYLSTAVFVLRPTLVPLVVHMLRGAQVIPLDDVLGDDPFTQMEAGLADMENSQIYAAAAGALAAGVPVDVTGTGVLILDVAPDGPAGGVLRPGDVVVSAEGVHTPLVGDLATAVLGRPEGSELTLTVERGGKRTERRLTTGLAPGDPAALPRLGVLAATRDLDIELPFEIRFRDADDVFGPSAGLAYALAIADALSPEDIAAGRVIAATGEIGPDGSVGDVGGVGPKAESARRKGAGVFVVPGGLEREAGGRRIPVLSARSLADAIAALRSGGV